ncbi:DnaD domain protein [Carnobacterium antarcticum]|uniref:DnaD domain protein n=1 Tax=Carnobacterium antarcticum TaxID=2126436 RepID=A0ABW4NLW2_9LACT|nr:DnaD domain protein [Carnobacterium sp. CP1]ALV21033.1 Phage replication initiation protein [Carnobacterium sp. CP1]
MEEMGDTLKLEGVMSKGYGIIPKLVMMDKDLSIEAKAIYSYIASYAGNGVSAFPSIKKICYDLQINEKRFSRHKKVLLEKGYIEVTQERKGGGMFASNVYTIKQFVTPTTQNRGTDKEEPTTQNGSTVNGSTDKRSTDNGGTNNNSSINNSITNNSSNNLQQQPAEKKRPNFITAWEQNGFGTISPMKIEQLDHWVSDFGGKEEIIVKAIELADDNGKRSYNYVEAILKNWENKGVKELSDIDALEKQRQQELAAKKSKPTNQYNKQPIRKETLTEWHGKPAVTEKPMDAAAQAELQARLDKIRAL